MSFFWLKYRYPDGQFAGAVVIEGTSLTIARLEATVFRLDDGLVFAGGQKIDDGSAHHIPESMIDRLLDLRDLRGFNDCSLPRSRSLPKSRQIRSKTDHDENCSGRIDGESLADFELMLQRLARKLVGHDVLLLIVQSHYRQ